MRSGHDRIAAGAGEFTVFLRQLITFWEWTLHTLSAGAQKTSHDWAVKTAHFEETMIRRVGSRLVPAPRETDNGESAQNGGDQPGQTMNFLPTLASILLMSLLVKDYLKLLGNKGRPADDGH